MPGGATFPPAVTLTSFHRCHSHWSPCPAEPLSPEAVARPHARRCHFPPEGVARPHARRSHFPRKLSLALTPGGDTFPGSCHFPPALSLCQRPHAGRCGRMPGKPAIFPPQPPGPGPDTVSNTPNSVWRPTKGLQRLLDSLKALGFQVTCPSVTSGSQSAPWRSRDPFQPHKAGRVSP